MNMVRKCVVLLIALGLSVAAWGKPERGKGPPPEAIQACEQLGEGDQVSFVTPRGHTIEATCRVVREQLIAIPNNHPFPKQAKDKSESKRSYD